MDPINGIAAVNAIVAAQDPAAPPHTERIVHEASDSVKLSPAAQVRMLRDEGELLNEIGAQLHLSPAQVLSDLGITSTIPTQPETT
jgi:hypothetical protein